ncbi:MAG: 23S rRNA (guanosine(2251)-2'-O)-methyltransferase RlmB, partial [bacterium]
RRGPSIGRSPRRADAGNPRPERRKGGCQRACPDRGPHARTGRAGGRDRRRSGTRRAGRVRH